MTFTDASQSDEMSAGTVRCRGRWLETIPASKTVTPRPKDCDRKHPVANPQDLPSESLANEEFEPPSTLISATSFCRVRVRNHLLRVRSLSSGGNFACRCVNSGSRCYGDGVTIAR